MTTGQLLFLIWIALGCGLPLAWICLVTVVRRHQRRRNVTDLTEWRELHGAITRHPAAQSKNVRRVGGRVTIR